MRWGVAARGLGAMAAMLAACSSDLVIAGAASDEVDSSAATGDGDGSEGGGESGGTQTEPGSEPEETDEPEDPDGPGVDPKPPSPCDVVEFADPMLEKAVRLELGLGANDALNPLMVAEVDALSVDEPVFSLEGAQCLVALRSLSVVPGDIVDPSPVGGLKYLEYLELSDQAITTVDSLADAPALRTLDVGDNPISDLSPLAEISTLESLYLGSIAVDELDGLDGLDGLTALDFSGNGLDTTEDLDQFPNLTWLYIQDNAIPELLGLPGTLHSLDISRNPLDGTSLPELTSLTSLYAEEIDALDLSSLAGVDVWRVRISGSVGVDLSPLDGNTELSELEMADTDAITLPIGLGSVTLDARAANLDDAAVVILATWAPPSWYGWALQDNGITTLEPLVDGWALEDEFACGRIYISGDPWVPALVDQADWLCTQHRIAVEDDEGLLPPCEPFWECDPPPQ